MKKIKSHLHLLGLVIFLSLFPLQSVSADAGPKLPPMTFDFEFRTLPVEIKNLTMLACADEKCLNPKPTGLFSCNQKQCWSFFGPDEAPYYKIEVEFFDKMRASNVFTRVRLSATYLVTVSANGLEVKEVFRPWLDFKSPLLYVFAFALLVTVVSEKFVAGIFSKRWGVPIKWVRLVNLLSLPILWFAFPMLPIPLIWVWLLGESCVICFEALFLYLTNRPSHLSVKQVGLLSLTMNVSSIIFGIIVVPVGIVVLLVFIEKFFSMIPGIIAAPLMLIGILFLISYVSYKLFGPSDK